MKKSLLVISVILLIAGLFISCNSEAAGTNGDLAYVKFADDGKGLNSSITPWSGTPYNVNNLVWYYKATHVSGVGSHGETTTWTRINTSTGLSGQIGPFSLGLWKFQIIGCDGTSAPTATYNESGKSWSGLSNNVKYYGLSGTSSTEVSSVGITRGGANIVNITIHSTVEPASSLTLTWNVDYNAPETSYNGSTVYYNVKVGSASVDTGNGTIAEKKINMSETTGKTVSITTEFEAVTVTFEVFADSGKTEAYLLSRESISFPAVKGSTVNVTGSIDDLGYEYAQIGTVTTDSPSYVSPNITTSNVAYVKTATTINGYDTLADAINAATAGDTVGLLKDVTTAANINKAITLDGNGHSISGSGSTYKGTTGSGGYDTNAKYMLKVDNAAVTVKNLDITSTGGARSIVVSSTCPSITLNNVNITSGGNCVRFEREIHESDPSSVRTTTCNVDISNCTFDCSNYALYMYGPVDGSISNTSFSGWNALYFKPGSTGSNLTISNSTIHEVSTTASGGNRMSTPGGNGFGAVVYEDSDITLAFTDCAFTMEVNGTAGQTLFMANDWNAINYNEHVTINSGCTFTSIGTYEAFLVYSLTGGTTFDLKVAEGLVDALDDTVEAPETKEFDSITRASTSNTIKLGFAGEGSTYGYSYTWVTSGTTGYKSLNMPTISTGYWMTGSLVSVGEYAVPITTDYISTALTKGTGVYTTVSSAPVTPSGKNWVSYTSASDDQKSGWYSNFATNDYYKLF